MRAPVRKGGLSAWNKRKQNYLLIFTSQREKTAMRTQQWAITVTTTELVSDFLFYLLHGRGFSARQPASTHTNTTKSFIFEESADFLTGSCEVSVALEELHFLIYADRWPDRPRASGFYFQPTSEGSSSDSGVVRVRLQCKPIKGKLVNVFQGQETHTAECV